MKVHPIHLALIASLTGSTACFDPDYEPPARSCGPLKQTPALWFDGARLLTDDATLKPGASNPEAVSDLPQGGFVIPSTGGRGFLVVSQEDDAVLAAPLPPGASGVGPSQVLLRRPRHLLDRTFSALATEIAAGSFDGRNYVVAWAEAYEPYVSNGYDRTLKLARVTPAGEMLDPDGVTLHVGLGKRDISGRPADVETELPVVASNGAGSLVVWAHRNSIWPRERLYHSLYAARFRADGTLVDPEGFVIVEEAASFPRLSLLWDGSAYILVYQPILHTSGRERAVRGVRLSAEGEVLGELFTFSLDERDEGFPRAAFHGDSILLAWHSCETIRAALVHRESGLVAPGAFTAGTMTPLGGLCFGRASVSAAPGGFAVAWTENYRPEPDCLPTPVGIFLRGIGADGTLAPITTVWP